MKYDFTTIMDRQGMDAIAVDQPPQKPAREGFDVIPMWIADMNFATVPTVVDAMIRRAQHPAFGYFSLRQEYYDGILRWHKTHHDVELTPENILYANGVLGGVVSALNVLCSKGDNVLVHSPTYVGFTHALGDNGYNIVHSPLVLDEGGIWSGLYKTAWLCRDCKKAVFTMPEPLGACDPFAAPAEDEETKEEEESGN